MEKRCKVCGAVKALDEFYKASGMRDGRRSDCKACNLAAKKQRYDADPELHIARVRRWQQENAERYNAAQRRRRSTPEARQRERESHLRRTFGITQQEYDRQLAAQGGGCAICGRPPRPDISLQVDHHHGSGRIRGLLCFPCNNAVGQLREDLANVERLRAYLIDHDPEMVELAEIARARVARLVASRRG